MVIRKCLYTHSILNRNSPPDDNTESKEHIIPYALGGSNDFVTFDCSKKANNDFGRDIDAPFMAIPLVGMKRHEFAIKGQGGSVPPIEFKAKVMELNEEGTITFPHNGIPYMDLPLTSDGSMSEGKIAFAGSPDRVKVATKGLLQKANRKGLQVLTQDLAPITDATTLIENVTINTGQSVHVEMRLGIDNFFEPWEKGILKIVLGLGHKILGEQWTFSPSGDRIRLALVCPGTQWQSVGIKGDVLCKLPTEIKTLLRIKPNIHTVGVLPYTDCRMAAIISLFGGEVFDAIVDLGDDVGKYAATNDTLPRDMKICFHIDPSSRKTELNTLEQVLNNNPHLKL